MQILELCDCQLQPTGGSISYSYYADATALLGVQSSGIDDGL